MPHWIPTLDWLGRDVFVIGGGNSLENFDWDLLEGESTIGCNNAFELGQGICNLCIFGDPDWFKDYEPELALYASRINPATGYKGIVFTNTPQMFDTRIPWVWTLPRSALGLDEKSLAWNHNTGASAINLALILGAQRVHLLGFDMHLSEEGKPNWHPNVTSKVSKEVYEKYLKAFHYVKRDLGRKFPGKEIVNVTNNSNLNYFPKIGCEQFWKERKKVSA